MMKLWDFFNGKKTVIAAVLGAIASALEQAGEHDAAVWVGVAAQVMTAIGVGHKAAKSRGE